MFSANPWFVSYKFNSKAKIRLFCFHHGGGNASFFSAWKDQLPLSTELIAVELPGHGSRYCEPLFTDMHSLVTQLSNAIWPLLDKPYHFFGHSLGALVAFELAHTLKKKGALLPQCLIVSGRHAPHIKLAKKPIYNLPHDKFIHELKKYNGISPIFLENIDLMDFTLPAIRADFEIVETYIYNKISPLTCNLVAFGGLNDFTVKPEDIEAWKIHTSNSFLHYMFPGDHFFIKAHQEKVLEILSNLDKL